MLFLKGDRNNKFRLFKKSYYLSGIQNYKLYYRNRLNLQESPTVLDSLKHLHLNKDIYKSIKFRK